MPRNEPTKPHFPPGRKTQAELDWDAACDLARDTAKHEITVPPKCTVPQKDGPTLHEGDAVDPDRIEGGMQTVIRLRRDGYILQTDPRRVKANKNEYDLKILKAVIHSSGRPSGPLVLEPNDGVDVDELAVPGTEGYQTIGPNGRLINRPGRPERPGREIAEDWIKRGLAERARLRDKVTSAVKKRLAKSKAADAGDKA